VRREGVPTPLLGSVVLGATGRRGASTAWPLGRLTAAKVFEKRTFTGDGGRVLAPELPGPLGMLPSELSDFLGLFLGAGSGLWRERFREKAPFAAPEGCSG
jgi:hypothetical protein